MNQLSMIMGELESGDRRDELIAAVTLLQGPGGTNSTLGARIDQVGSAVELLREMSAIGSSRSSTSRTFDLDASREMVESWLSLNLDVRMVLDPTYPYALRDVFDRPALLFLRGTWKEERDGWAVAIVGTRQATLDGHKRAQRLSRELAENGYPIISGLAHGIDASSHLAALKAGGVTHAVMGTGLNYIFPQEHEHLAQKIVERDGCLITQFLPSQKPTRWTFPLRNRVMSGLSMVTVVVEGGETSGSRIQAERALEHGRPVFLMRSLVEGHAWAQHLVDDGLYGVHADILESSNALLDRLSGKIYDQIAL